MKLTPESPRAEHPDGCNITLKPHQLAMLKRVQDIEDANLSRKNKYGIMKDRPGAGKTYVLLSLIKTRRKRTTIVVVPQNIYTQWIKAIKDFSPNLTYKPFIDYQHVSTLYYGRIDYVDILITIPLYYGIIADAVAASNMHIDRVIIDEVDSVEFFLKKNINVGQIWLVSASFDRCVLKELDYTNSVTDSIKDSITCICDEEFVKQGFHLEPYEQHTIICESLYLDMLQGIFAVDAMSAINAMDYTQIQTITYKKVAHTIVDVLDLLVKDLVETIADDKLRIESFDTSIEKYVTEIERDPNPDPEDDERREYLEYLNGRILSLKQQKEACQGRLENLESKLKMITDRLFQNKMCLICYDTIEGDALISPCCKNVYCKGCMEGWFSTRIISRFPNPSSSDEKACPYCRAMNKKDDYLLFVNENDSSEGDNTEEEDEIQTPSEDNIQRKMNKLDTIQHLLTEKVGEKVIIFSNYSRVFKTIKEKLEELGISCAELDGGNIASIDKAINSYKYGDTKVLMTNSSFYGCGMNLENTTDIIFVHKIDNGMFNQVVGRAQRPGRTSQLKVYTLLHENENSNLSLTPF